MAKLRYLAFVIIGATLSVFVAAQSVEELTAQMDETLQQIETLSQDKRCETDDDCASLPIGHLACGGPSDYRVYSTRIDDESQARLSELSQTTQKLAKQLNEQRSMMSICSMVPEPVLSCRSNICIKQDNSSLEEHPVR